MSPEEKNEIKSVLLEEKARIEEILSGVADKNAAIQDDYRARFPKDTDPSDSADERAGALSRYQNNVALEENMELRLQAINKTLARIEAGEYGTCEKCQSEIHPARLKAMPVSSMCIDCANKATLL